MSLKHAPCSGEPREAPSEPIEVPYRQLSPEALRGVVESFVLREGTDYGEREVSLDDKIAQVLEQLRCGEARILYDPASQSIDIQPCSH